MSYRLIILLPFICLLTRLHAKNTMVSDKEALHKTLSACNAGDTVIMQSGIWNDVSIICSSNGTKQQPIVLMAAKAGTVILSGQSDLKLGGDYLQVFGLQFKDGHTPSGSVIEFRTDNEHLANHCRVSNCLITDYSQPKRFDSDNWILLWGKNNRVDHCTFEDKLNTGPTLVVNLNDERSQENNHLIDHNHFKGRQRFGANGGESMRIGVSRYSLSPSRTTVRHNYFERCSGEVEIISVKSGHNHILNNFFFECEGGLVLRHGDSNVVEHNVFVGNNKPFTGGIRVINSGHTITNNVMIGLAGDRFRSAMTLMNGVPNSLINRYFQVSHTRISNNTFINCKQVLLGGGKDAERTLGPVNTLFTKNLLVANKSKTTIVDDNHDGGISFKGNEANGDISYEQVTDFLNRNGELADWNGLLVQSSKTAGADLGKIDYIDKKKCGVAFEGDLLKPKIVGRKITVTAENLKALQENQLSWNDGDTLLFPEARAYGLAKPLRINKAIVILGTVKGEVQTELYCNGERNIPALVVIENGGSLTVSHISFKGAAGSFGEAACGIGTTDQPMNKHYKLIVDGCHFYHYNESGYAGIRGGKGTFADTVLISNCLFRNISGTAVNFSEEKDDKGFYNVDYLRLDQSKFSQILNAAVNVYRGGNDESTTGPSVRITGCLFNEVDNKEQGVAVKLIGVQDGTVSNNIFNRSGQGGRSIWFEEFRWDNIRIVDNRFFQSGKTQTFYEKDYGKNERSDKPYAGLSLEKL